MPTKPKQHKEQLLFNNIFQNPPANCSHSRNSTAKLVTKAAKTKVQTGRGYFCCEVHPLITPGLFSLFINASLVLFPEMQFQIHNSRVGTSPAACPSAGAGNQKWMGPPGFQCQRGQRGGLSPTHRCTSHQGSLENFQTQFLTSVSASLLFFFIYATMTEKKLFFQPECTIGMHHFAGCKCLQLERYQFQSKSFTMHVSTEIVRGGYNQFLLKNFGDI